MFVSSILKNIQLPLKFSEIFSYLHDNLCYWLAFKYSGVICGGCKGRPKLVALVLAVQVVFVLTGFSFILAKVVFMMSGENPSFLTVIRLG